MTKKNTKQSSLTQHSVKRDTRDITPSVQRGFDLIKYTYNPFVESKLKESDWVYNQLDNVWRTRLQEDLRRYRAYEQARRHELELARRRKDQTPRRAPNWSRLAFKYPNKVPLCQRRKSRKRAIFAYAVRRITSKAGGGMGRHLSRLGRIKKTFNEFSSTRC